MGEFYRQHPFQLGARELLVMVRIVHKRGKSIWRSDAQEAWEDGHLLQEAYKIVLVYSVHEKVGNNQSLEAHSLARQVHRFGAVKG